MRLAVPGCGTGGGGHLRAVERDVPSAHRIPGDAKGAQKSMSVEVYIENAQTEIPVDEETLHLIRTVIAQAAAMEQVSDGEVSVVLVDDATMQQYNAQYRGVDKTTDV